MRWLSCRFVTLVSLGWLVLVTGIYTAILVQLDVMPTADYSAHLTGGRIAWRGEAHRLYEVPFQHEIQREITGEDRELNVYLSPPVVAWLYAPFALLPYRVSIALWAILSAVAILASLRLLWGLVPNLHPYGFGRVMIISLATTPVLMLLGAGQDTSISLMLVATGVVLLQARRDASAGAMLGLLVFKPQLALLVPVVLLLTGKRRALGSWCAVAALLAGISVAMVGWAGVQAYASLLTSDDYTQEIVMRNGMKMITLPALLRFLGATSLVPVAILGGLAVLGVVAVRVRATGGQPDVRLVASVLVLATVALNPHMFLYDGTLLLVPGLLLLNDRPSSVVVRLALSAAALLAMPFAFIPTAPWIVMPVLALLGVALGRLAQAPRTTGGPVVPHFATS